METNLQYITIPIDILQMDIPLTHKLILALSKMKDGCYLKNSVIANLLGLSKSRVSHIISELVKMGLIEVELEYKPLSKEVSKRTIISKAKDVVAKVISKAKEIKQAYTTTKTTVGTQQVEQVTFSQGMYKTSYKPKQNRFNLGSTHEWDFGELEQLEREYIKRRLEEINSENNNQGNI